MTVHLRVPGGDGADRTLEPGEDDDRTVELACPRSGDVDVTVVDDEGTATWEETIRCRPWPTLWSIAVSGARDVGVERSA